MAVAAALQKRIYVSAEKFALLSCLNIDMRYAPITHSQAYFLGHTLMFSCVGFSRAIPMSRICTWSRWAASTSKVARLTRTPRS